MLGRCSVRSLLCSLTGGRSTKQRLHSSSTRLVFQRPASLYISTMGPRITKVKRDKYDVQGTASALETDKSLCTSVMSGQDNDNVEQVLCDESDLKEHEMKEFTLEGGARVLLLKEKGEFSALGAKCTHYGAPLAKGVLRNGTVRCPWHGACFNSKTGDIEDYPGLDSLPKFEVKINDGKVKVIANKKLLLSNARVKPMNKRDPDNNTTYVIVGAGAAAAVSVEMLRQEGFTGRIIMVTKELHLPYDRPKLSKMLDVGVEKILLRSNKFYSDNDIEVMTNKEVVSLDASTKYITFQDGSSITFDKVLLATGGKPRRLNVPGSDLQNVVTLRSVDDANLIATESQGKNVVILGLSFIGMEAAAYLVGKAKSVTVVGTPALPFLPVLGKEIATRFKDLFEEKGVIFSEGGTIKEFVGENGKLTEIILGNDERIPADLCLLGIGVTPCTDFVKDPTISKSPEGFILVDEHMKSTADAVYAAGDIVKFPLFFFNNQSVNIQHWQIAHAHGRNAALNMLDKATLIHTVPYFWTVMFGKSLRYTGYGFGFDDVIILGDLEKLEFIAFLTKEDQILAVVSMNQDPIVSNYAEFFRSKGLMKKSAIRDLQSVSELFATNE